MLGGNESSGMAAWSLERSLRLMNWMRSTSFFFIKFLMIAHATEKYHGASTM